MDGPMGYPPWNIQCDEPNPTVYMRGTPMRCSMGYPIYSVFRGLSPGKVERSSMKFTVASPATCAMGHPMVDSMETPAHWMYHLVL